jgi:hypothetical protein
MTLTAPVLAADLQLAYPRDTRGMEAGELDALLRLEERALRSQYRVSDTTAETDAVLADAMKAAWPTFLQQVRNVAAEDVNADGVSVNYSRAGVVDFAFPKFIAAMLAPYADASGTNTIRLVRG